VPTKGEVTKVPGSSDGPAAAPGDGASDSAGGAAMGRMSAPAPAIRRRTRTWPFGSASISDRLNSPAIWASSRTTSRLMPPLDLEPAPLDLASVDGALAGGRALDDDDRFLLIAEGVLSVSRCPAPRPWPGDSCPPRTRR